MGFLCFQLDAHYPIFTAAVRVLPPILGKTPPRASGAFSEGNMYVAGPPNINAYKESAYRGFTGQSPGHGHVENYAALQEAIRKKEMKVAAMSGPEFPGMERLDRLIPEIAFIGYWDVYKDQEWCLEWPWRQGLGIAFLDQGSLDFAVQGRKYPLQPGHMTFTLPGQVHRLGTPKVSACRLFLLSLDLGPGRSPAEWEWPDWILLSPQDRQSLIRLLKSRGKPVLQMGSAMGRGFSRLKELLDGCGAASLEARLKMHVNEILIAMLDGLQSAAVPENGSAAAMRRKVGNFLADLPNHLTRDWDLEALACQCGLGRSRFNYLCLKLTNRTPMNYLTDCRIEAASRLLGESPELTIDQVALRCGIQSGRYLGSLFRKRLGISPTEYKQKNSLHR
jgi:AraC family transcriptional regulator, 4-hydroxyphenylacetate 3-monooxygenase operon regulatory protein